MKRKVDALDDWRDAQGLGPPGEYPHDGGAPRGHADEIKGRLSGGRILAHNVLPSAAACGDDLYKSAENIFDFAKWREFMKIKTIPKYRIFY